MAIFCLYFVLLCALQTSVKGAITFTSPYGGTSVYGAVGSSVTFTWRFSGAFGKAHWGLKATGVNDFQNGPLLVSLDSTGMLQVTPPLEYRGRVNGTISLTSSSGQAIFTLTNIKTTDEKFFGCRVESSDLVAKKDFDSVKLVVEEPPVITDPTSANVKYNEGAPVNISCKATGKPDPHVMWFHNGQVKRSGSKQAYLTFITISKKDTGMYTCRANNSAGNTEKQVNIVVNYKPEGTTITLSKNTALQGEDVTLTCLATAANPAVSEYRFYLNDTMRNTSKSNSLTIIDVQRSKHYGKYECVAHNDVGDGHSNAVVLNVNVPATIKSLTGNVTVNETNPIDLKCNVYGYPVPAITWKKDKKELKQHTEKDLRIDSSSKSDSGKYTCAAQNVVRTVEVETFVTVNYKPEGTTITLSKTTALQGENVTLTCHVTAANPAVSEYRFYLNDTVRDTSSSNNVTIINVQRSQHYGKYKCVAHNNVGDEQSNTVVLDINVPATIKSLTGNVTVNKTNPIDLKCDVYGYPVPTITWKKDEEELQQHTGKNLRIDISSLSDSGKYTCAAQNVVRTVKMETFVTVHYRASITRATSSATKSWIGQTVQLTCEAAGVPTPVLTWKKPDGIDLKKVTATKNVVNAVMKEDEDFGLYTCEAENGVGAAATSTVEVKQIKAPSPPSITSTAADIQATSLKVKWTEPADDGGSPITAYRVFILQGGNVIKNENITDLSTKVLDVGNLNKDTNYTVKVYARNYVFEGNASLKIIKTKYEGVPAAPEIKDLPFSTKEVEVTITWNEPQNNGADITQYTVYQRTVRDNGSLGDWNKLNEIKGTSERKATLQLVKGKEYEFVVTATNKFGESLKEEEKIQKITVLGGVPAAVQFTAEEKDGVITLKWKEPENNGAPITKYSVYQRFVNDKDWKKLEDITDTSKLDYDFKGDEGMEYEFVVTATNKYGESSNTTNIKTVKVSGTGTDRQNQANSGMNMAVIAGAAAAGVLLILALIIFGIWWKRRKTPSEHGSSVADLSGRNPDDFDDGYHAVGAAAAAHQLQASGRAAEATYAQVDMSQKKNRRPVTDLYAEVDKSKKTKKKRQKQPGELDYAELDDLRPNFQPAPQPPGAAARPLVRAPAYEGTEYADITQFGVPQPEPTYDNVPKKDVVYSNVESM